MKRLLVLTAAIALSACSSIRVVQPLPGTHEGIDEHAESATAAVSTSRRFIGVPSSGGRV